MYALQEDAAMTRPPEPLTDKQCGALGLCERRKGHEGTHTTSVDRATSGDNIRLFHGHHPNCPYTVEGDWTACRCGASSATLDAARAEVRRLAEVHNLTLKAMDDAERAAREPLHYVPVWREWEKFEDKAAKRGSGATQEQMTGAAMMLGWLIDTYLPAIASGSAPAEPNGIDPDDPRRVDGDLDGLRAERDEAP